MDPYKYLDLYFLSLKYDGKITEEKRIRNRAESLMFDLDDLCKNSVVPSATLAKFDFPYFFQYTIPRSKYDQARAIASKYGYCAY